jgi:AbrB family looped-hinge helix DNA binding protein
MNLYFNVHHLYSGAMRGAISRQGQVTIPKHVRDALGLKPGDRLEFAVRGGELVGRKKRDGVDLEGFVGIFADGRRTDDVLNEIRPQRAWRTR